MGTILDKQTQIVIENTALPGVKRVANYVAEDMRKVFGSSNAVIIEDNVDTDKLNGHSVVVATLGYSSAADAINTASIAGKREVYLYTVYNNALWIVGSDKRGTIYGLFHLSELMGVSPFVNWGDVIPRNLPSVELDDKDMIVSKEPSVRFRGFFINDEWPAFGNWCTKRFGGFNAECYEKVFELLLRLKGNYLWPAMWSAQFNLDGPGIENARLADEMGVVMGMSHHEPCNRNGEEYKYVRGPQSIYGDDWNFVRNREGITRFWKDGLLRNAEFENVITVGMRGEADSTILGHEATLKDNIEYLKDVLRTQEKLIKECVNEDIDSVPRMLALYKEVEPFFYGDENTQGLMDSPELEGVTLMLCDDNFGNLRTLPTEHMRKHRGGYGMYYHFDYHGSPISYEWVNSTYLPKVWEQMGIAYDNGIRDLWIVNVGDIFTTEFPLGYFLDMAYDYDKWGSSNPNSAYEYTEKFVSTQFPTFSKNEHDVTYELLNDYTYLAHNRRPETINVHRLLDNVRRDDLDALYKKCVTMVMNLKTMYEGVSKENKFPFFEFVYYPAMGNLNTHIMWLENAYSTYLASIGALKANEMNSTVADCIEEDYKLVEELHSIHDGFWYGMGMSEHLGFKNWNEEECQPPVLRQVLPTNKARVIATVPGTMQHTEGGDWTKQTLKIYSDEKALIELFATSYLDTEFTIDVESDFLGVSVAENVISNGGVMPIMITIDTDARNKQPLAEQTGRFTVNFAYGHIQVEVYPSCMNPEIKIEGLKPYSNEVEVWAYEAGEYDMSVFLSPSNPPYTDNKLYYSYEVNQNDDILVNAVSDTFKVGDNGFEWYEGVLNNYRISKNTIMLKKGTNTVRLEAKSVGTIFRKVIFDRK